MREMTFEELLESLGIAKDQISAITSGMKANKIYLSAEENIDERYGKLKGQHETASTSLKEAQELIAKLQPLADGNETMKTQIADFEKQVAEANERAAKAERDSAVKVELLAKGANPEDVDYLMYRIDNGETKVEVGKDGKLTGIDDAVAALKTKFPKQFKEETGKQFEEKKLPGSEGGENKPEPKSLAEALQAHYEQPNQ